MSNACPKCGGAAVRVEQTGALSCAKQCDELTTEAASRRELEGFTADLARLLGLHVPAGYTFTLVLNKTGPGGCMAYASSAEREGVISMLREIADKIEVTKERPS